MRSVRRSGGWCWALLGPGPAFLINAISFLAVIVALLMIHVPRLDRAHDGRGVLRQFARGAALRAAECQASWRCFVLVLALGALGSPVFQLLAVFADQVFHVGDLAYGFLGASLGVGALLAAPRDRRTRIGLARSRLVMLGTTVYGAALVLFALAPWYGLAIVGLLLCGGAYLAIASTLNTTLQLQVDEVMRGKVIAAYIMFLTLAMPLGHAGAGRAGRRDRRASHGRRCRRAVPWPLTWWLRLGTTTCERWTTIGELEVEVMLDRRGPAGRAGHAVRSVVVEFVDLDAVALGQERLALVALVADRAPSARLRPAASTGGASS